MRIFIDESGNFAFPPDRFDAYVLAGLVCPDHLYPEIDAFVQSRQKAWGVSELHAKAMKPRQIAEVARFICDQPIAAVARVTDTELMDRERIRRFRIDQAARIEQSKRRWLERGGSSAVMAAEIDKLIASAGLAAEVSDAEFVQQHQMPLLLLDLVQASVDRFLEPEWEAAFEAFDFVLDSKLPDALSPGEEYARQIYKPVLGSSQRFALDLPLEWKSKPTHPFRSFDHEDGEHTDLKLLFASGLRSEDSADHAGLQLVDVIANTVRRAVIKGPKSSTWKAFNLLRNTLATREGAVKIYRFRDGPTGPANHARYAPVLDPWICPLAL